MQTQYDVGIISRRGSASVDETVARVRAALAERRITLFALIDHSGEAARAGMAMPPTKLLIFGSPAVGTPAMLAAPSSALDLPLKLLVWADAGGQTWLSYNEPEYLQDRHRLPASLARNLGVVEALAEQAARGGTPARAVDVERLALSSGRTGGCGSVESKPLR